MFMKKHRGVSAEWIIILGAQFGRATAWYFETYCIKTISRESVFIRSQQ
jgi:hypothetical protein